MREVTAGDGRTWQVRRRWQTRLDATSVTGRVRRRFRQGRELATNSAQGWYEFIGESITVAVGLGLFVIVLFLLVFPIVALAAELTVLMLLVALALITKVVFRHPWTVEARADDGTHIAWKVVGWRASGTRCDEIADSLQAGIIPPDGLEQVAPTDV